MWIDRILRVDENLTAHIRLSESHSNFKPVAAFFAHSGDSWFDLIALFLLWLFAHGPWRSMAALMAASTIVLALLVFAIKFTIRRRRPEGDWGAVYRNTDPHSFPSGHAARTSMLAVIALKLVPLWFGLALVVWALLVCLARVWMGVHYLSDVIAGVLLGIGAGYLAIALLPWLIKVFPFIF